MNTYTPSSKKKKKGKKYILISVLESLKRPYTTIFFFPHSYFSFSLHFFHCFLEKPL